MDLDADKIMLHAVMDGMREGVKAKFSQSYDNPLTKVISGAIKKNAPAFQSLLDEALKSCIGDGAFREEIKAGVRHQLAKQLIQKFGGELEKQVNTLKSDPATRARITLAIDEIVKTKCESPA